MKPAVITVLFAVNLSNDDEELSGYNCSMSSWQGAIDAL